MKNNTDGSHNGESAMVDSEMNDSQDSDTDSSAGSRLRRSGSLCKKGSRMESPVIGVARALGETQYSEEVLRKVNQYKVGIYTFLYLKISQKTGVRLILESIICMFNDLLKLLLILMNTCDCHINCLLRRLYALYLINVIKSQ